ncbi:MAG: hypothetical protein R3Y50_11280 [Rikenellaceae bacterium]
MRKIIYTVAIAFLAVSCYKSDIYNTPNPTEGTTKVTVEWSLLHDGDSAPTTYTILQGGVEQQMNSTTNTFILEPTNDEEFVVYNSPSGVVIKDGVASLGEMTRTAVDPEIMPENLYYGVGKIDFIEDYISTDKITTKRGTAPLTIKLSYDQSEAKNIGSVKVELSGIASERNLRSDALSSGVTLTQYPTIDTENSEITLQYNILGTTSDFQELKITLTTTDNQQRVVVSDISSQFLGFNSAMNPLTLSGNMNLPADLEIEGSISDWMDVVVGDGEAI